MNNKLTIAQAVELAKKGRNEGFDFLYNETYKTKYYLALKYMKSEDLAEDIMQEAYIKAFKSLDKLTEAEKFSSWLGVIIANTAKNALIKKKAVLFSELDNEDFDDDFEKTIEDERKSNQPEASVCSKETQELVHMMLDNLSDEQKICMLAFYIDNLSIKEIATALDCSENTVKSRLNYGRKNIKAQGEELRKKGHTLYGLAPLPFLLYLLKTEQISIGTNIVMQTIGSSVAKGTATNITNNVVTNLASETIKKGFLQTMIGKLAVGAATLAVTGSVILFATAQGKEEPIETVPLQTEISEETSEETSTSPTEEATQTPSVTILADEDYSSLIAGNLTKEEFEYLLYNIIPTNYETGEFAGHDTIEEVQYTYFINGITSGGGEQNFVENLGNTPSYASMYSLEDINKFLLAFTPYQFVSGGTYDGGISIVDNVVTFYPATHSSTTDVDITSGEYTDEEMTIYYMETFRSSDMINQDLPPEVYNRKAILHPIEDGLFRISTIVNIENVESQSLETEQAVDTEQSVQAIENYMDIYKNVLNSVKNQETGYTYVFAEYQQPTGKYQYFLHDINGDGITELIVGAEIVNTVFYENQSKFFTCEHTDSGYHLKQIEGETYLSDARVSADGNGLLDSSFGRMNGNYSIERLTIEDGKLTENFASELDHMIDTEEETAYRTQNKEVTWFDIDDLSGLTN